jgi:DNA/RNA-binding domain of Phe-tRNA-synthetase-like protein
VSSFAIGAVMTEQAGTWLDDVRVDDEVFALRPDYVVVVMAVDGLRGGPSDAVSERLLVDAEHAAGRLLADAAPEELAHVAQWREAFRAFGAKPQRTRPSVEALLRRVADGLPRIDRITDAYNAVSVARLLPIGGEDRENYVGAARLSRADGTEDFEIRKDGVAAVDHPEVGEVVWRDDAGVTCRRWNWRQTVRTRITEHTQNAVFILDALGALGSDGVSAAADALQTALEELSPAARFERRTIARG